MRLYIRRGCSVSPSETEVIAVTESRLATFRQVQQSFYVAASETVRRKKQREKFIETFPVVQFVVHVEPVSFLRVRPVRPTPKHHNLRVAYRP